MENIVSKDAHEISDASSIGQDVKMPAAAAAPPQNTLKPSVTKKTRKKDKNKPKRPLSAYNLFFKDERLRYLQETASDEPPAGPRDKFLNMSREIGRRWMNLSSARRKIYDALAEEAMFRYRVSMESYKAKKKLDETSTNTNTLQLQQQSNQQQSVSNDRAPALESFLLANHSASLQQQQQQPSSGFPLHMLHSAVSRELLHQQQQSNSNSKNLLDYLLLEKLAQNRQREDRLSAVLLYAHRPEAAEDRMSALLNAHRPEPAEDRMSALLHATRTENTSSLQRMNQEERPMFLPDSRWLYENVVQSLQSRAPARVAAVLPSPMSSEQREQQTKELLEFVRQQQNPMWAQFLSPDHSNQNNNSHPPNDEYRK